MLILLGPRPDRSRLIEPDVVVVAQPLQCDALVVGDGLGQGGQREPAQLGALAGLLNGGVTAPCGAGVEPLDALLAGIVRPVSAVHHRRRDEVAESHLDPQLLAEFPRGRLRCGLARIDVPGRARGPVPVHVAGVLTQLQ